MASRFATDTAVTDLGDGRYRASIDRGWWIERGPNGGYVAAVILRALVAAVDDPVRSPRSLTVHYLAPPTEGPCEITVVVERRGRQLSYLTARMSQGQRLLALAMAAFAVSAPGLTFTESVMPVVPQAADLFDLETASGPTIELRDRYRTRWAIGALPFTGGTSALNGGWIRLAEPSAYDHALLTAISDAWLPPVFSRVEDRLAVPTIDLTVHFRAPLPHVGLRDDDYVLTSFRSTVAADGFIEEDGEIWSPDGVLLAQSRQLALLLPVPS